MAKEKTLSKEDIELKSKKFDEWLNKEKELMIKGRNSPAKEFLSAISNKIKEALDSGVSYNRLSKMIHEIYGFKVSEQTLRSFAQIQLGIPKKTRGAKRASAQVENKENFSPEKAKKVESDRVKSDFNNI